MMDDKVDVWIQPLRTDGEQLRLICFPYAGGGPHIFQKWSQWLPGYVGLHAVHLPGRGTRLQNTPVDRLQPAVAAIVKALWTLQNMPCVFFGHSMGALLAFETARALRYRGAYGPQLLITSACKPPQLVEQREWIHDLPDEAFIRKIGELGGTPAEVLQNRELLELLMPALRADFAVIDTYQYAPAEPLACPITVVCGSGDPHASSPLMEGWSLQTSCALSFHELEGDHFFIHTAEDELRQIVVGDIERWVGKDTSTTNCWRGI